MAKVMEPHPRNILYPADQPREFMRQAAWLHWLSIRASANECIAALPYTEKKKALGLLAL